MRKPVDLTGIGELDKLPAAAAEYDRVSINSRFLLSGVSEKPRLNSRKSASDTKIGDKVGGGVRGACGDGDRGAMNSMGNRSVEGLGVPAC